MATLANIYHRFFDRSSEQAAEARFGAEDIEPLQRYGRALQAFGHAGAGVVVIGLSEDGAGFEQLRALLDVGEIGN